MPGKHFAKPQPTLTGFTAWAFNRLVDAKGEGDGPVAKWIIDRWIEDNLPLLAEKYGIKREQFQPEKKILQHPGSKR